jgi:hypothetical protein
MKFSVFEVLKMVEMDLITKNEAWQLLELDEALNPPGEFPAGSAPDVGLESQPVNALPLSE